MGVWVSVSVGLDFQVELGLELGSVLDLSLGWEQVRVRVGISSGRVGIRVAGSIRFQVGLGRLVRVGVRFQVRLESELGSV